MKHVFYTIFVTSPLHCHPENNCASNYNSLKINVVMEGKLYAYHCTFWVIYFSVEKATLKLMNL